MQCYSLQIDQCRVHLTTMTLNDIFVSCRRIEQLCCLDMGQSNVACGPSAKGCTGSATNDQALLIVRSLIGCSFADFQAAVKGSVIPHRAPSSFF